MWNMGLPEHYEGYYSQHQPRSSNAPLSPPPPPPPPPAVSGRGLSAKPSIFYVADQYKSIGASTGTCPQFHYQRTGGTTSLPLFTSLENSSSQTRELGLLPAPPGNPEPKVASKSAHPGVQPNKTRIRWTPELHDRFLNSVGRLGGAEKATPKEILKLMNTSGLTIYHVKSHLQKYRSARYVPETLEGRRRCMEKPHQFDLKTTAQISEALQQQLDVQRRLHEQLEGQRNMQIRIEEQAKQLWKMFEEQAAGTEREVSG